MNKSCSPIYYRAARRHTAPQGPCSRGQRSEVADARRNSASAVSPSQNFSSLLWSPSTRELLQLACSLIIHHQQKNGKHPAQPGLTADVLLQGYSCSIETNIPETNIPETNIPKIRGSSLRYPAESSRELRKKREAESRAPLGRDPRCPGTPTTRSICLSEPSQESKPVQFLLSLPCGWKASRGCHAGGCCGGGEL